MWVEEYIEIHLALSIHGGVVVGLCEAVLESWVRVLAGLQPFLPYKSIEVE